MINCIIVDDQTEAIDVIVEHLKHFPLITLTDTFTDPLKAMEFLKKNKVNLVFLDIEMPNLNGLEFIESLRKKNGNTTPQFILTTGYQQYALSGFDQGAADYLLKPIVFERFKLSIERFLENRRSTITTNTTALNKNYFFIESEGSRLKLNYKDIVYIESERNCIHIFQGKSKKTIYKPMHYIESVLNDHPDFIRIHKSYIISMNYVDIVKANEVVMNMEGVRKTISIGATYKENVLNIFK